MQYKWLGNTGVQVSQLCLGTMTFGAEADESESAKLYAACRDKGVNFFDCANVYSKGKAEEILGDLVKGERDDLVITSKCFFQMDDDVNARGANRRNIALSVEASLKRLGTDRLDVLFMHGWDDVTPLEETLRALENLVSQGKVLYLGASNYSAWQIAKGLGVSERYGWPRFDVIQPMYNLVKRQAEVEILPLAEAEQLGVIPYGPNAGGLLSGKYAKGKRPEGARLVSWDNYKDRYGNEEFFSIAEAFSEYAKEKGIHPVSLAVSWAGSHPAVTSPIIGARNVDQLKASLDSVDVDMTPELREEITRLSRTPPPATDRLEEQA